MMNSIILWVVLNFMTWWIPLYFELYWTLWHDEFHYWNSWNQSEAAGVAGNTALVYTVGNWFHAQLSHPPLGELQGFSWGILTNTFTVRWILPDVLTVQALESYIDLTLVEAVVMCLTRLQPLLRAVSCLSVFHLSVYQPVSLPVSGRGRGGLENLQRWVSRLVCPLLDRLVSWSACMLDWLTKAVCYWNHLAGC